MEKAKRGFGIIVVVFIVAALVAAGGILWYLRPAHSIVQALPFVPSLSGGQNNPSTGTTQQGTQTGSQPAAQSTPITQRSFAGGIIRYSVPVVIGGKTIQAMLDTGSTGLRILSSAMPAQGYALQTTPSRAAYGGPIVTGTVAQATVDIAGVSINTPIEVVDSITCEASHPGCDTANIFGYDAILGVGMRGQDVPNPLSLTTSKRWIINLPPPGSGTGELILNPTDATGYANVQLAHETASDVALGITPGWASNQIPVCISRADTGLSICKGTSFDSGAFNVRTIPSSSGTPWPKGTQATIAVTTNSGTLTDTFTVGSTPGTEVYIDPAAVGGARNLNTGPLPFFTYSMLYDYGQGTIGLKLR